MPISSDKFGRDYDALLAEQRRQLRVWENVLRPEVFAALRDHCELMNGPAEPRQPRGPYKAGGLHSVPVGVELHHIVMRLGRVKVDDTLL